jgi:hypothetical protein
MTSPAIRLPSAIFSRFVAGESLESIAQDYEIDHPTCESLLQTQCRVVSMGKSQKKLRKLLTSIAPGQLSSGNVEAMRFVAIYAYQHGFDLPDWFRAQYDQLVRVELAGVEPASAQS